jgi:hypothetical protein
LEVIWNCERREDMRIHIHAHLDLFHIKQNGGFVTAQNNKMESA